MKKNLRAGILIAFAVFIALTLGTFSVNQLYHAGAAPPGLQLEPDFA